MEQIRLLMLAAFLPLLASCGDSGNNDPDSPYPDPLYVTESTFEFSKEGGYKLMHIISQNITWEIIGDADWIDPSPRTGGSTEVVRLTVEPNNTGTTRRDTIYVRSTQSAHPTAYDIIVTQSAVPKKD